MISVQLRAGLKWITIISVILIHVGLFAKPNVLLILTDDQGYGDLSLHGNPHLRTPAMDRLGKESVRLDRFYVSPVCGPTRASLMTGRYHVRTGAFGVTRREEVLNPAEVTIAEVLQKSGYATGCFGKWHNGNVYPETPNGQGFDEFLGVLGGLSQLYFNPVLDHNGEDKKYEGYITEILADAAIDWMDEQIEEEKPFFCYVPFNAPHTPGLVEDEYWKKYYNRSVGRWEAVIYGMIERIDEHVARMMEFLEEKDQVENTIVIFMSDNGPATWRYNAGLRGKKGNFYDGGIRVPCFIRWPGKLDPTTIDLPLAHIDILPTLVEWCGAGDTKNLELDGKSFASLAENPATPWEERKIISFAHADEERIRNTATVHTNKWTAVQNRGKWELFDIIADIRQRDDVAKKHPEVLEDLRAHFEDTLTTLPPLGQYTPFSLIDNDVAEVALEGNDALLPSEYKGKGIDYNFSAGFSHHWISFWTRTEPVPEWIVEVVDPGTFEVSLLYCIPESDLGVQAHLEIQGNKLPINITESFDPLPNPQPFLLDGESIKYENKDWKQLTLGEVTLSKGASRVRIHVTEIPGEAAMELKEVVFRRLEP